MHSLSLSLTCVLGSSQKGWQVFEWELSLHPISEVESVHCDFEPMFKVYWTDSNTVEHRFIYPFNQRSQTRGLPDAFYAAREHAKNWKMHKFWSNFAFFYTILVYLKDVLVNWGQQQFFSNKLHPVDHFYLEIWPSDKFEFKTPAFNSPPIMFQLLIWYRDNWVNRSQGKSIYLEITDNHFFLKKGFSSTILISLCFFSFNYF